MGAAIPNPELQFDHGEQLLVGFRGNRDSQLAAISLCRRYDGAVLFREGDVMIVEIDGDPNVITDLLARLPRSGVTHLWRSGAATRPPAPTNFAASNHGAIVQ